MAQATAADGCASFVAVDCFCPNPGPYIAALFACLANATFSSSHSSHICSQPQASASTFPILSETLHRPPRCRLPGQSGTLPRRLMLLLRVKEDRESGWEECRSGSSGLGCWLGGDGSESGAANGCCVVVVRGETLNTGVPELASGVVGRGRSGQDWE
ncbi:hypothetical protein R3P38DRAFT_243514 [Favolaschia claudopus]|uniref:Uncharacterized protein n=1 Tax=Favolaschia claudopus TaxID=2862362 RepID=A0AAW0CXS9_9AGAR